MVVSTIRQWALKLFKVSSVSPRPRRVRLHFEVLEDRDCPTTFPTVPAGDVTTLIADITTANANNQADVINLTPGSTYTLTTASGALPNIGPDNSLTPTGVANTLTINGNGATITRDSAATNFRIFNIVDGRLFINNLTISNGLVAFPPPTIGGGTTGGGIRVIDGTTTTTNGTLDNLVLRNSLVVGNTVMDQFGILGDGGGIALSTLAKATIINSTISGNTAAHFGGGVAMTSGSSTLNIVNSTIAFNVAKVNIPGSGGGVSANGGTVNLSNTLVSNNHIVTLAGAGDDLSVIAGTVNTRNSLYQTAPSGTINLNMNTVIGDPLLGTLKNNGGPTFTHAITSAASPAIGKGDSTLVVAPDNVSDQRGPGFNRNIGGTVDIGSYEFQPPAVAVGITSSLNPSNSGQSVLFVATVAGTAVNSNIPQGTVSFVIDGVAVATVVLVNGNASFATTTLLAGSHQVFARYNPTIVGDYSFATGASSVLVQTVKSTNAAVPHSPPYGRRWRR